MKTVDFYIEHSEFLAPCTTATELISEEQTEQGIIERWERAYDDGTVRGIIILYNTTEMMARLAERNTVDPTINEDFPV